MIASISLSGTCVQIMLLFSETELQRSNAWTHQAASVAVQLFTEGGSGPRHPPFQSLLPQAARSLA